MLETLMDSKVVDAPDDVAHSLKVRKTLWLETVRRVNGDPTIRSEYWLPTGQPLNQAQRNALSLDSGIRAIRELVGFDMTPVWRGYDAAAASRRDAGVLEIPVSAPVLVRFGLNSDFDGNPVLFIKRYIRAGSTRMVMRYPKPSSG